MKKLLLLAFFTITILVENGDVFGQVTYTSNGTCAPSDPNYFSNSSTCWNKTGTCIASLTPIFTGNPSCKVTIIINHPITFTGDITLGGNIELIVNNGGEFNMIGSLSVSSRTKSNIISVNGGKVNVSGNLNLSSGGNNATEKTELKIDIKNQGTFNVGGDTNLNNDTNLIIDGDNNPLSAFNTSFLNLDQRVKIDVLVGGGLIVKNDVDYRGNNSSINIDGFFRTDGSVIITGGNGNQLNAYGDAEVIIVKNLDVRGTSDITFGGNSQTDIGGEIIVAGNSKVIATENAVVFVCGNFPTPCDGNNCNTQEKISGTFSSDCRILPVELLDPSARYENTNKLSLISWATAKEVSNSHFEIERSDKGINDFKKVGEIDGMGWKDTVTEYEFIDDKLPLSGGNILYRIKQVDFDGNSTYSKVLSVRAEGVQATQGVWRAFPNPTMGDLLRISLLDRTQYDQEQITFRIVHPNLITQGITVNTEDEMNDQLAQLIPRAPKGVLVVEIQWGQKVEHIKVLKK